MNKKPTSRELLGQLWSNYVKKHRFKLIIAVSFMLLEGAAYWVFVQQLQPLFDSIFVAGNEAKIWGVAFAIFGVFMIRGIGSFIHRSLTAKTGIEVVSDLQQDLTQHLLKLDIDYFNKNSPGGLIERVRGDTQALQAFASNTLITLGRDLSSFVALLIAAIGIDATWTAILFIGIPVLILPLNVFQRLIRNQSRKARQASANLSTRLDEVFHGIKAIKLNNLAEHESQRFSKDLSQFVKRQLNAAYSRNAMLSTIEIAAGFGFVAIIYYGGNEIIAGDKTTGEFVTFFVAIAMLLDPIRRLASISGAMQGALANLERIHSIFIQEPTKRPTPVEKKLKQPLGDIRFENVTFSYGDVPVLKNLSFWAPGGKTTAFVGPSGAGKSTLFNLLTHLEIPSEGEITVGGQNINSIPEMELRKDIALVNQESALFDESILDNIKLGDIDSAPEKAVEASHIALVSQFADELPDGLDSLAGPRGSNLSGGQRQRVIIARALLRDAPILLLDEATSALDNRTEKKIQSLLNEITAEKTTLVIAHRLTTVMNADLIHVMHEGQIVESGTHEELLAMNNHYKALHSTLEK